MLKIVIGVMRHPQFFHYSAGAHIGRNGIGDDFFELQCLETISQRSLGSFDSDALAPHLVSQPPTDLDARREVCRDPWHGQADKANKRCYADQFDCPEAKAMLSKVGFDPISEGVAFFPGESVGEELHHPWVGIQLGEGETIFRSPATQ